MCGGSGGAEVCQAGIKSLTKNGYLLCLIAYKNLNRPRRPLAEVVVAIRRARRGSKSPTLMNCSNACARSILTRPNVIANGRVNERRLHCPPAETEFRADRPRRRCLPGPYPGHHRFCLPLQG